MVVGFKLWHLIGSRNNDNFLLSLAPYARYSTVPPVSNRQRRFGIYVRYLIIRLSLQSRESDEKNSVREKYSYKYRYSSLRSVS
jgi:hypothetical protein